MRTRPLLSLVLAVCSLVPGIAAAGTPNAPEIVDQAGDANYVNHQGLSAFAPLPESGPDARPASLSSADLVAVWYDTTWIDLEERDDEERIVRVRRVPSALRVHIRTAGPAAPSFGPTVNFAVWARVGFCNLIFRGFIRGPASGDSDPPQRGELRTRSAECLEGPKTYTTGMSQGFDGNVMTLMYPFETMLTESGGLIEPGFVIEADPGNGVQVSTSHTASYGGLMIDLGPKTKSYVVGSDVPPDVDCLATPNHPLCAG